jgi:predicted ArsR family transcriptional regulator
VSVSVPPREYGLLAGVLAEAVEADQSGTVRAAVAEAARKAGRAAGGRAAAGRNLTEALRACGYEPSATADGGVELRNCPFHRLAHEHTELVCGLNLHLVRGILEASGHPSAGAILAPRPGRCCVLLQAPRS